MANYKEFESPGCMVRVFPGHIHPIFFGISQEDRYAATAMTTAMTTDAARSLAAALIQAANYAEGKEGEG